MKIKILAKKLSLSGIDKSLCSIVNMLSVNHEVTLVQTYKEENGTHKLNDNVKQVFLLSSEKEEKRSIVKKLLLKIKVGFLNKSVIKKEIKKNDYDVLITSNSTYVKWFKYNKMNKYKVFIENNYHLDNKKEINFLFIYTSFTFSFCLADTNSICLTDALQSLYQSRNQIATVISYFS